MTLRVVVLFLVLAFGGGVELARAQAAEASRVYVSALLTVPWSQGVTTDEFQLYLLPPGGWSVGWSAAVGTQVSPYVGVEFEFARTGIVASTEPSRYFFTYHPERRDNFFVTAVRFRIHPARVVHAEPVIGFDLVKEEAWLSSDYLAYNGGPTFHAPRTKETRPLSPGLSFGVDVCAGSGRAAFVASFRAHRTWWRDEDFGETKRWTLRPSAGLRISF